MTNRNKGLLMVSFGASMWGGSGVAGQYLLQDCGFSTEWLVVSRMILAGLILLLADRIMYKEYSSRIQKVVLMDDLFREG